MRVKGINKLLKQFQQFGKDSEEEFALEVEAGARNISKIAKSEAPANNGQLRQSIQPEKINELNWEIIAHASYAGYIEFGTGVMVSIPNEMKDIANAIKNNPKGDMHEAFESIKDWCRNKGIDERAAWPILMSILKKGLRPRPFLFPAWKQGSAKMIKDMKKTLKVLSNKFNNAG